MKRLILIRHGQTQKDKNDPERTLTFEGEDQIARSAQVIKNYLLKSQVIMHSPALRARQSALIIGEIIGCEDIVEAPLRIRNADLIKTRVKANEVLGIPAAATYLQKLHDQPHDLETPEELYERLLSIFDSSNADCIIAVSHEASLDAFLNSSKGFKVLFKSFERWFGYADYVVLERI